MTDEGARLGQRHHKDGPRGRQHEHVGAFSGPPPPARRARDTLQRDTLKQLCDSLHHRSPLRRRAAVLESRHQAARQACPRCGTAVADLAQEKSSMKVTRRQAVGGMVATIAGTSLASYIGSE